MDIYSVIYNFFGTVFGNEFSEVTLLHMMARTLIASEVILLLFRINKRFLIGPTRSVFNYVLTVMIGSLLAIGITGGIPFLQMMALIVSIMVSNYLYAALAFYFPRVEAAITGKKAILYQNGEINWAVMRRNLITHEDLIEVVHVQLGQDDFEGIDSIIYENNGDIVLIRKKVNK